MLSLEHNVGKRMIIGQNYTEDTLVDDLLGNAGALGSDSCFGFLPLLGQKRFY